MRINGQVIRIDVTRLAKKEWMHLIHKALSLSNSRRMI
jgi:hypothetical protein